MAALERFLAAAPQSSLRTDALALLVWDAKRSGSPAEEQWARQLLTAAPENPLALATLIDSSRRAKPPAGPRETEALAGLGERGLRALTTLRKPEGMSAREFALLEAAVKGTLSGALGIRFLDRKEYAAAQDYLRSAVAFLPNDPQYVYALALACLNAKEPNLSDGFWFLAGAVNLTQGTPTGAQLAEFANRKYAEHGGTAADWNRFLAAAAPSGYAPPVGTAAAPNNRRATALATAKPGSNTSRAARQTKSPPSPTSRDRNTRSSSDVPPLPPLPPEPAAAPAAKPRPVLQPGEPLSLGILIETAITGEENRRALIYSLTDLVRHLRSGDEAFVLSFSNDLVFEQDLTSDSRLLERATANIQPHPGTALFDAIAFAAGHLDRIARNRNRVLLVISDGRNTDSHTSSLELSGNINASAVRIFCIGVGVAGADGKHRLQALASRTGGQASFITDLDQFRTAAQQIAASLGINFPL